MNISKLKAVYESKLVELGCEYKIDGNGIIFNYLYKEHYIDLIADLKTLENEPTVNPSKLFGHHLMHGLYDNYDINSIFPIVMTYQEAMEFRKKHPEALINTFEHNLMIGYVMEISVGIFRVITVNQNRYNIDILEESFNNLNKIVVKKMSESLEIDHMNHGYFQVVGYSLFSASVLFTLRYKRFLQEVFDSSYIMAIYQSDNVSVCESNSFNWKKISSLSDDTEALKKLGHDSMTVIYSE